MLHAPRALSCTMDRHHMMLLVVCCTVVSCVVGGSGCTAYDVVINPTFFESINSREILMGFFLTVVLEGLEAKYNMTLDRRKDLSLIYT